ncbi:MAG TPA: hypothetical protein VH110_01970 [Candidatus Acidoferrum sp.]|nr:hypothetical protein [Candidatus Acidoferrum sp.]
MTCLSVLGIATGIGLLLLRNWARFSVLIWGGFSVFFGGVGIPIAFLAPFLQPPGAAPLSAESVRLVRWMMLVIYGVPLTAGIWWLILFNRKSVKAQFSGPVASVNVGLPQKPRCPLPIAVLAWFYITSILNFIFLPLLPFRVPVLVFGRVLPGNSGVAVLLLSCLAWVVCGIGLLKLKPWSYSLTIGLQVFWLASTAVSLLSPNYDAVMQSFLRQMESSLQLDRTRFSMGYFTHHYAWAVVLGLFFAGTILALLVYYRPRFLEAASAAVPS